MILPGEDEAFSDPYEIREKMEHEVDLIIDSGVVHYAPTTILNLTGKNPEVVRRGKGKFPDMA
jgi:tRNA A37 threonylcarbamoyladenosine synthetase subunit TsaC/SUA5/YrdC